MNLEKEKTWDLIMNFANAYYFKDTSQVDFLLSNYKLDWGFFLEQIIKHKLIPFSWVVLSETKKFEEQVPFYIRDFLSRESMIFEERTKVYLRELNQLVDIFNNNNIEYALVKGLSIENQIFSTYGVRQLSDIDFIINGSQSDLILQAFAKQGFISGKYNILEKKIVPFDRKKIMFFQVTKDHLPDQIKEVNNAIVPTCNVDLSLGTNWGENVIEDNFVTNLLNLEEINFNDKFLCNTLKPVIHFIYIIQHLYKHAWSYRMIQRNISVRLSMFIDVYLYWLKYHKEIKTFFENELTDNVLLLTEVSWVLHHVDSLFNSKVSEDLNLKEFLLNTNAAFGKNYKLSYWKGSITERLTSSEEKLLFI